LRKKKETLKTLKSTLENFLSIINGASCGETIAAPSSSSRNDEYDDVLVEMCVTEEAIASTRSLIAVASPAVVTILKLEKEARERAEAELQEKRAAKKIKRDARTARRAETLEAALTKCVLSIMF